MFRPTIFGKYVLLKRIAIGGMAEVFRAKAYGSEGFEKLVAIKRMLSHLSEDVQFVDMFINEAKLAAALNHANIAQIYDFGCIDNQYFLSMEYIHGKDVADIIRMMRDRGLRAPIEMACFVIIEALNGLSYAHRQTDAFGHPLSLIHRDMSPHNVIVSHEGEVKIADFGIAKAKNSNIHTMGGVLKGKYSYMSPEQAHGMKLDHRTDLFSLGICMYELLTLTKMFQGQSDLNVLEKVRETNFVRPRKLNPDIPEGLERLLLKALEKNPDDRYRSANEWRDELERYLFQNGLHYSTSWLSSFMHDVFRDQIERSQGEFAEEVRLAQKLRVDAKKEAKVEVFRDTVVLKSGLLPDLPPIREVDSQEEEEPTSSDTARAGVPLGALRELRRKAGMPGRAISDVDPYEPSFEVVEEEETDHNTHKANGSRDVEVVDEIEGLDGMEASQDFTDYEDVAPEFLAEDEPGGDFDDESLPTVELSRPAIMKFDDLDSTSRDEGRPAFNEMPPGIREVPGPPIGGYDYGDETDSMDSLTGSSEVETFDERSGKAKGPAGEEALRNGTGGGTGEMPLLPHDFDESQPTFKNPAKGRKHPVAGPLEMDGSTMRGERKGFPLGSVLLILFLAASVGGLAALWFHGQKTEEGNGSADAGIDLAVAVPIGPPDAGEAPAADADQAGKARAADEDKRIRHFEIQDGGAGASATVSPDVGQVVTPVPDEIDAGVVKEPVSTKPPVVKKKKRRKKKRRKRRSTKKRNRRRVRKKCPTKGQGMLDVGISGGWAFVYIDGSRKKTTPLFKYKVGAGRHKVQLRSGDGKVLRSWSICVRANERLRLFHQ